MRSWRRAVLAVATTAATLLTSAACSSDDDAAAPSFVEAPAVVVPPDIEFTNRDLALGHSDKVPDPAGPGLLRVEIPWLTVQPTAGTTFDWTQPDYRIGRATAAGMKILLLLTYSPEWASGQHGKGGGWFPTTEFDPAWKNFVDQVVRRYGNRVKAFEIWNEPNLARFGDYGNGSDAVRIRRYWDLVKMANTTLKAACPACLVVAGASAGGSRRASLPQPAASKPNPNSPAAWLDWAYRNGYGTDFDAVAHHPYPIWTHGAGPAQSNCARPDLVLFGPAYKPGKPWQKQCGELSALRAVMVAHGDTAKKIWGTEWGYPMASYLGPLHVSAERIRDYTIEGLQMWRNLDYTGPLVHYEYADSCTRPADSECNFGMVDAQGRRKEPIYSALITAAQGLQPVFLPSGQSLRRYESLQSANHRYTLTLKGNGDLILYDTVDHRTTWSLTGKFGRQLVAQPDGNLVLYRDPDHPIAVWSSGTTGGAGRLLLQDDGNLVLYRDADGTAYWATETALGPVS
ncbi:hypothetical protein [Paractinoplanes durhamensis]|uniref:hypothetical protein n=1 Tax=Paractinoplanes durhamensis TaxID=113563 RepID=UPI001944B773|nr:hypothetical protein [Actinoplanes durhamensis]